MLLSEVRSTQMEDPTFQFVGLLYVIVTLEVRAFVSLGLGWGGERSWKSAPQSDQLPHTDPYKGTLLGVKACVNYFVIKLYGVY